MSVASPTIRTGDAARPGGQAPLLGVRRAPRHVLVGVALMVAFALLFALLALRADPASPVLALARAVPAGAAITDADLAVVRVVPDPGVPVVREADRGSVLGRTAAVPLVTGSLLSPAQLGTPAWPAAGESVIGVPVAEGRMPAGLAAGSRVSVLLPAAPDGADQPPAGQVAAAATVVAVEPPSAAGVSTVSLLMDTAPARRVAAAGEVVLVLEHPQSPGAGE